jgi:DNA-directed RNA polymerase subunit omega
MRLRLNHSNGRLEENLASEKQPLFNSLGRANIVVMARITVEDCLLHIPSRFELVVLAAKRAKQLLKGAKPLIESDNRAIVIALREISAGKIRRASAES